VKAKAVATVFIIRMLYWQSSAPYLSFCDDDFIVFCRGVYNAELREKGKEDRYREVI
jgi:hypothetical protein